jgi:prepilin-type N-terminal cleavage/methylation domain-containing protein
MLNNEINMKNRRKEGFTLIELLIVIGIIAILAAAVIIAINPGQQFKQARNATRWSHMNSVVNAAYSYLISEGGASPDCNDGSTDMGAGDNLRDISHCATDLADHIGDVPADPQAGGTTWVTQTIDISGTSYTVDACSSGCKGYVIGILTGGSRIIVTSVASEAVSEDIAVLQ